MIDFLCRHDLTHVFDKHMCDGCCARVPLEPAQKGAEMVFSDCKKHNWLYDEFEEQCPLCEAVNAEQSKTLKLVREVLESLFYKPDATVDNVMVALSRKLSLSAKNGHLNK